MRLAAARFVLPLAFLAPGCASIMGVGITPGQAIRMAPKSMIHLPDRSLLRYVAVENDSRCPPKVTCVRAGDADLVFEHAPTNGSAQRFTVNSATPRTVPLGAWTLSVLDLAPGASPSVEIRVDPSP